MTDRRYRVLLISSHPVQYVSPLYQLMAQHPQLEIQVAYCSLQGAEPGIDAEFGVEVTWDIPLLEGYPWVQVPNRSPRPGLGRFWGLVNPGLWPLIWTGQFEAVVIYTGYVYASFWIGAIAARLRGVPLLFNTDATSLDPRQGQSWKVRLKAWILPWIFQWADVAIATSSAGQQFLLSLGLPKERVALTPFVVDNDWWSQQADRVDRSAARAAWGIPATAPVVLFCAKLQPWKRPQDVLQAFIRAAVPQSYLLFAGAGPLRADLEAEAEAAQVADRVKFLGFVNQSQLPAVYRVADLFVLPSGYDPCPVVVCEAMVCGCPVVLSDEIRGRFDLVQPESTGFIYPCGDTTALAQILQTVLPDQERLQSLSVAARQRMTTWSPRENVAALIQAVAQAIAHPSPPKPVRILFYSPLFYPSVGGTEMVMLILAQELVRLGHEVVVVTQTPAADGSGDLPLTVVRSPAALTLLQWVGWSQVVFQGSVSLKGLWPLLLLRRPLVVTHQTWYRRLDGRQGWQDTLKYWVSRIATNVAPSLAIAAQLPGAAIVIPNPYRADIFREWPNIQRQRDLVFLGRLVSDKGVDLLITALATLKAQGLTPCLTIVGTGPEAPALEQLAQGLGVRDQIEFVGVKLDQDLAQVLNAHQILVVPSRWEEPFGIVALEGIACGCVVVGSAGGGLKDAIGPCGVTFPNGDAVALAQVLADLLTQPNRLAHYRQQAATHLPQHQGAAVARAYLDVFEGTLQ